MVEIYGISFSLEVLANVDSSSSWQDDIPRHPVVRAPTVASAIVVGRTEDVIVEPDRSQKVAAVEKLCSKAW